VVNLIPVNHVQFKMLAELRIRRIAQSLVDCSIVADHPTAVFQSIKKHESIPTHARQLW